MHGTLDEMATRPVAELLRMVRESQGYAECSPELWLTPLLYAIERKAAKLESALEETLSWVEKQPYPKDIRKHFHTTNERAQAVKAAKYALGIWKD